MSKLESVVLAHPTMYKMTAAEAACLLPLLWRSIRVPCLPSCAVGSFKALWVNQCLLLLQESARSQMQFETLSVMKIP